MTSGRRWYAFWLLVRVVGWLSWMAWGQAVALQGTVAVVYPETDEPAYRAVFESVIQGIRNRIGPSQIQTYALAAGTNAPGALKAWLVKQTTARALVTLGRGAYEDYQAGGITLPAVSGLLDGLDTPRDPPIEPLRDVKRAIHRRFAEHLGIDLGGPLRAHFDTVFGTHAD